MNILVSPCDEPVWGVKSHYHDDVLGRDLTYHEAEKLWTKMFKRDNSVRLFKHELNPKKPDSFDPSTLL